MLLLPENTRILGQGITGSEGSIATPWMLEYGTQIVAGVTPGKGGQNLNGVPIFNSVKEAIEKVGMMDGTVQYVPALRVKAAAQEAIEAGIGWILIGAEKVPTKDAAEIHALAKKHGINVIGPASVGIISTHHKLKIGSIGGGDPNRVFPEGEVAIISKSGGMTSEIGLHLKHNGLGVSWAVGIGGDRIIGSDFVDFLLEVEDDNNTKASIIFGELGGTYEERVADYVKSGKIKKPIIAFIAGEFTLKLPSEVQFGHAGAIIEGERGKPDYKRKVLKEAGVRVVENFDDIAKLVKEAIHG